MLPSKNISANVLIDTNIALRYLLHDDKAMAAKAKGIISCGAVILPEVMAEVIYVLQKVYKVSRHETCEALKDLLTETETPNPLVIEKAIELYEETSLDFVDCILIAYHRIEKL